MKLWMAFFFAAVLAALALRLPELGNRPMHNDEGVNAMKFGELWDRGEYRYDPTEHHGPTLHYFTAALCKITGAPDYKHLNEVRLRLATALAGVALLITDECINCDVCEPECPNEAISLGEVSAADAVSCYASAGCNAACQASGRTCMRAAAGSGCAAARPHHAATIARHSPSGC